MELLRVTSIAPYGVPHAALEDVVFHGYRIPKGTSIYPSIYSTHYDPAVWDNPKTFNPERFLTSNGTKVHRHELLISFSIGRRACIAETFAKGELFLYLTGLVQQFTIEAESGKPKPKLEPRLGQITLEPHTYSAVFLERL